MHEPNELRFMERYGRAAFEMYWAGTSGKHWEGIDTREKIYWCDAADAVLREYDPEWPSQKASL